jgi:hypothetical protein
MSKKLKQIIVIITDNMLKDIHQVADQLASKGMKVDRVMPVTGVIAGSAPSTKIPALEKVEGVMSVEEEATAYPS